MAVVTFCADDGTFWKSWEYTKLQNPPILFHSRSPDHTITEFKPFLENSKNEKCSNQSKNKVSFYFLYCDDDENKNECFPYFAPSSAPSCYELLLSHRIPVRIISSLLRGSSFDFLLFYYFLSHPFSTCLRSPQVAGKCHTMLSYHAAIEWKKWYGTRLCSL